MAAPTVTASTTQPGPFAPGAPITATWTVVDPDNSTEKLVLEGTDGQNNPVSVTIDVNRQDAFTMNRVYWQRTGVNLAVDNAARKATGVIPTA